MREKRGRDIQFSLTSSRLAEKRRPIRSRGRGCGRAVYFQYSFCCHHHFLLSFRTPPIASLSEAPRPTATKERYHQEERVCLLFTVRVASEERAGSGSTVRNARYHHPLIALHPTAVSADCTERSGQLLRSDAVQESDREGDDAEQAEGGQGEQGKVAARSEKRR